MLLSQPLGCYLLLGCWQLWDVWRVLVLSWPWTRLGYYQPQFNWTIGNMFQWNQNLNMTIFIQENIWKMGAILSRLQCANRFPLHVHLGICVSPWKWGVKILLHGMNPKNFLQTPYLWNIGDPLVSCRKILIWQPAIKLTLKIAYMCQ